MRIFGVAILAICFLVGKLLGTLFGFLLGIDGDVGGVGFATFLLILAKYVFSKKDWLDVTTAEGINFWGSMYIPVIVAMITTLNVHSAPSGWIVAILSGALAAFFGFYLVGKIAKIGMKKEETE